MMSTYVGKLLTSLSSALEFNTATLSGAIDILVIEDHCGRRHCSPFHVRFGKLQLLKSRGVPVRIELNGHKTSLRMFLGAAGEAYFFKRSGERRPLDSREGDASAPGQVSLGLHLEPSTDAHKHPVPVVTESSPRDTGITNRNCDNQQKGRKRQSKEAERQARCSQNANLSFVPPSSDLQISSGLSSMKETAAADLPFGYVSDSEVELTRHERDGTSEVVDEPRSPPVFAAQRKWAPTLQRGASLEAQPPPDCAYADTASDHDFGALKPFRYGLLEKLEEGPVREWEDVPETVEDVPDRLTSFETPNGGTPEAFVRAPLSDSTSNMDVCAEEDYKLELPGIDRRRTQGKDTLEGLNRLIAGALSHPGSQAFREHREGVVEGTACAKERRRSYKSPVVLGGCAGEESTPRDALQTDFVHGDHVSVVPMSLCRSLLTTDMRDEHIMELFMRHLVTQEDFARRPAILYDPELLFKLGNRLVDFHVAAPFVFSVLAFNESMDIDVLSRLTVSELNESGVKFQSESQKSPLAPLRGFGWFGWSSQSVLEEPLLKEEDFDVFDGEQSGATIEDGTRKDSDGSAGGIVEETCQHEPSERACKAETYQRDKDRETKECEREAKYQRTAVISDIAMQTSGAGSESFGIPCAREQDEPFPFSELDPETLSLRPTAVDLMKLDLKPGANAVRFVVESSSVDVECRIFLWSSHSKIVISDVDGTITRSDVLGHLLPAVGRDWSQDGVAGLYSQIEKNGYKFLYLTARPIGQASQTRAFLHSVAQGSAKLPNGPVLMSPNRLFESFTREVIRRRPHEFKISALRDVRSLFLPDYNPFHAGFGNRDTDVISYRAVGLIPQRIFVVNPRGELNVMKAKYESVASYSTLRELVESVFPDISGRAGLEKIKALTENQMFNDWNYWKSSLPKIDFDSLLQDK